jgi:hypothetical protein
MKLVDRQIARIGEYKLVGSFDRTGEFRLWRQNVPRLLILATVSIGWALPSHARYTQGLPVSGTSAGALASSSVYSDATEFSAAGDDCAQIAAARAACNAPGNSGCRVKAPFVGQNNCAASPFSGWGTGGELDLSATGTIDLRVSAPIMVPSGVHFHGGVASSSSTTSSSNVSNNKK